MKNEIASRLNSIAEKMPLVFVEKPDTVLMTGAELKLTPAWEEGMIDDTSYAVPIPMFIAVTHKQQIKDAYKKDGWKGVDLYCLEILHVAGALKGVNVIGAIQRKNGLKEELNIEGNYIKDTIVNLKK